jgi:hemoglobin/transferrin/lactoferrin receptor protein
VYKNAVLYCNGSYANGKDTQSGVYLSQIPPLHSLLGGKYSFPDLFTIDGSISSFATQDKTGAGELRTPGYSVYNFYLTSNDYDLGRIHFHVSAGVENIFNKLYRYHLSTDRGLIKYEPGRNFFFRVELRW